MTYNVLMGTLNLYSRTLYDLLQADTVAAVGLGNSTNNSDWV